MSFGNDFARMQSPRSVRMDSLDEDVEDATAKLGALHCQDESLPRLASLSDHERSSFSLNREHDLCPITGRLSNILDDYVVFPAVLGEGHYGCVRECIHRKTRKTFACKSVQKSQNPLSVEHLQNEVQILSEMDHRGIMRMVDCYEDADFVHIVSEKYTGGELFDVIVGNKNKDGCLPEREAARIAKSLLEAVAHLHDNDVVHRDIKPENILFQSQEERIPKLIDFGLSRRHARGEPCVSVPAGSSYYMSPEVLEGEYDHSCDLWAVGVIVYMTLCGYPPFDGDTDRDVFGAILDGDDFKFPARQWDSKSDVAKEFVLALLTRDPRRRMTAKEALRHPWVRGPGRVHRRVSRPEAFPRRVSWTRDEGTGAWVLAGLPDGGEVRDPRDRVAPGSPDGSSVRIRARDGAAGRRRDAPEASREERARADEALRGRRAAERGKVWMKDETGKWCNRAVPVSEEELENRIGGIW